MTIRTIGNNINFSFATYSASAKITANDWNEFVNQNLQKMQTITSRVPSQNIGTIVGMIPASVDATPGGFYVPSRQFNVLTSWNELNVFSSFGNHDYDIVPKHAISGPGVLNPFSNYWVFKTPGIYHINVTINYDVFVIPAMIRVAIVPYINDGVNYGTNSPFDNSFSTQNNTMPLVLIAYTGKADDNTTGSKTITVSGYVLVTSQSSANYPHITNVAVNSLNPLSAGNGYHIEVEGVRAYTGANRFEISGGTVTITLLQEWGQ